VYIGHAFCGVAMTECMGALALDGSGPIRLMEGVRGETSFGLLLSLGSILFCCRQASGFFPISYVGITWSFVRILAIVPTKYQVSELVHVLRKGTMKFHERLPVFKAHRAYEQRIHQIPPTTFHLLVITLLKFTIKVNSIGVTSFPISNNIW